MSCDRDSRNDHRYQRPRCGTRNAIQIMSAAVFARVVARRLLFAVPLLLLISGISYFLLSLTPGDPAQQILGLTATPARLAALRHQMGLDVPVYERYWRWLVAALHGDFGRSLYSQAPVTTAITQHLPVTLSLTIIGLLIMPLVGVTFGVISAARGGVLGRAVDVLSFTGWVLPSYWLAVVLVEVFAVKIRLFPVVGYVPLTQSPVEWLRSLVLPAVALSLGGIATFAKNTREAMLDVLASEHTRMAWASGIPPRRIFYVYALRNVGVRITALIGLLVIGLLGGVIFIESIFALPGLGALAVNAAETQDAPVVEGVAVFFTVIVVLVSLLTDLAYTWLDPRVRSS